MAGRQVLEAATVQLVGKRTVADGVVVLELAAPDGSRLPDWTPGAHVDVVLPNGLTRQYSLCGDRWDAHTFEVAVQLEAAGRGASAFVHHVLAVGDRLVIGTPRNNFPLVPADAYVFVAGGIGITPLVPMIDQAVRQGIPWRLLYAGRRRSAMPFVDELLAVGGDVVVAAGDEGSRLDLARELARPVAGARIYCCGPPRLLEAVERVTGAWPTSAVRSERFVAARESEAASNTSFEVELAGSGLVVDVGPGTTVLAALRHAGVDVLSSCGQGLCGTCEVGVLGGEPDHRDSLLDDDERAAGDCLYVCVSRSRSDRLVLDL